MFTFMMSLRVGTIYLIKAGIHLFFCTERLNNAQSAQCFFHLTHCVAPKSLCCNTTLFQLRPTIPISEAKSGTKRSVNIVSCHEINISVMKYIKTRIGFLNNKSSDDITEESTSCTSPLIRAIISPLRSSLKKLSESDVIF